MGTLLAAKCRQISLPIPPLPPITNTAPEGKLNVFLIDILIKKPCSYENIK